MSLAKSENHNFVWLECRLCFNRHVVTYTPARYHGEPRKGVYEAQALKEHLEMILPSPLGVWGLIHSFPRVPLQPQSLNTQWILCSAVVSV